MTDWEQPLISVDVVAVSRNSGVLSVATCARKHEPFVGRFALPGVLILPGEGLKDAVKRAVTTKLELPECAIQRETQFGAFDGTNRDPRGATISIAHLCVVEDLRGAAFWTPIDETPLGLPFDHDTIVMAAVAEIGRRLWTDMDFTRALIGTEFTTSEVLAVTRQVQGRLPDTVKNMARWLRSVGLAESQGLRGRDTVWRWKSIRP